MITYRKAIYQDYQDIADLHARSWQENYRGIMSDGYLNNEAVEDRMNLWRERLSSASDSQFIYLASLDEKLIGFTCVLANDHPRWGALLDNLHVAAGWKRKGIGEKLIKASAKWTYEFDPSSLMYLTVFEENTAARRFYERMGGVNTDRFIYENPGGGTAPVLRFVWENLPAFFNA